jgi:S1 RNA binding domain protein
MEENSKESNNEGSIEEGVVCGITNFGAFVKLKSGKEGLVHISELSPSFVRNVADYLQVGQNVKVKVLGLNKKGKLDLSIKRVNPDIKPLNTEEKEAIKSVKKEKKPEDFYPKEKPAPVLSSLEDKIGHFLKVSDERWLHYKRNIQSKQGSSKRKK